LRDGQVGLERGRQTESVKRGQVADQTLGRFRLKRASHVAGIFRVIQAIR
jgi:hypothetical protein